jgi:hypothetical protein
MTTEQVVRKLVSLRRKEVIEEHLDNKRGDELLLELGKYQHF